MTSHIQKITVHGPQGFPWLEWHRSNGVLKIDGAKYWRPSGAFDRVVVDVRAAAS